MRDNGLDEQGRFVAVIEAAPKDESRCALPMKPSGLAPVTLVMCVLNPAGFIFIKGSGAGLLVTVCCIVVVTYVVLWHFWKGRNWARWLVMVTSGVALLNLTGLGTASAIQKMVLAVEAALGCFLFFWLNTRAVRGFFTSGSPS